LFVEPFRPGLPLPTCLFASRRGRQARIQVGIFSRLQYRNQTESSGEIIGAGRTLCWFNLVICWLSFGVTEVSQISDAFPARPQPTISQILKLLFCCLAFSRWFGDQYDFWNGPLPMDET
jgi:hypothetical protein